MHAISHRGAEAPSAISRLLRQSRRSRRPRLSQHQLAEEVSDQTNVDASRDQIARLESGKPLRFVPELLAAVARVLRIPARTVGQALTRDYVRTAQQVRRKN